MSDPGRQINEPLHQYTGRAYTALNHAQRDATKHQIVPVEISGQLLCNAACDLVPTNFGASLPEGTT